MNRRRFLQTASAGLLVAPLAAEAQQADRVYRIGLIGVDARERAGQAALRQGLRARVARPGGAVRTGGPDRALHQPQDREALGVKIPPSFLLRAERFIE